MNKRILSLILALTMIFGMIPSFAMEAAGLDEKVIDQEVREGPEADLKRAVEIEDQVILGETDNEENQDLKDEEIESSEKDEEQEVELKNEEDLEEKLSIKIKEGKNSLKVGEEWSLLAEVKKGNEVLKNREITWSSSNDEIVTADENGKLIAHKVGEVDISASLAKDENIEDTIKIKIVEENKTLPKRQLDKNLEKIYKETPNPKFGDEWFILSLARGDYKVSEEYYDLYYDNILGEMEEKTGELNSGTDYSRLIIALTAIGKDVTNVDGYNLLEALADFEYVTKQGINGSVYALIALDSHEYDIPTIGATDKQTTRNKLIQDILNKRVSSGGWNWGYSEDAEVDMTAMAIQALSPYYNNRNDVRTAVDKAINWLSKVQKDKGGFQGWKDLSAENASQVIVALTELGINPHTNEKFVKNGYSPLDSLMDFAIIDGGFEFDGGVNLMTTQQGTYALVAYDRFINKKKSLYDMSDVEISVTEKSTIEFTGNKNSTITEDAVIDAIDQDKEIVVNILEESKSEVFIKLPSNKELPKIKASKGNISAIIPKGIKVTGGDSSKVELITSMDPSNESIVEKVKEKIDVDYKLEKINEMFSMGGSQRIEFDQYITLIFKDLGDSDAAYIENDELKLINKGNKNNTEEIYAYSNGNNLIVKTKHFTDFIAYTTKENIKDDSNGDDPATEDPENNDEEENTDKPASNEPYITLSIDKRTINKGYVLSPTKVEIRKGDTVWNVLIDELDSRKINYRTGGNGYIRSIDGDGEFDHGPGSGWMFMVDGRYPDRGANQVKLYGGERVEWRYTKNLGEDLGEDLSKWEEKEKEEVKLPEPELKEELEEIKKEIKEEITEIVLTKEKEKEIKEVLSKKYKDTEAISSWALNNVQRATELGFVEGYNGEFNPKAHVTRAEFVKMIISLLDVDLEKIEVNNFTDVNESDWFYAYINAAYEAGIVMGSEGKFNPNETMTREEMASIIVRLLKLKHEKTDEKIKDINQVSNWAKNDVESVVASGLLVGYENNFNPKDMATREMATTVLMRAYDYKNKE